MNYKSYRIIDGKPRWVIVDETGKVINRIPSKEELKDLEEEPRNVQDTRKYKTYTDEELLDYLMRFERENERVPTTTDFANNHSEYPSFMTYVRRFGSWLNSLKLAGLDIDLMGQQYTRYKGRQAEIMVINHFKKNPVDLSGENCHSPCDGICPNGKMYDVKSSGLYIGGYWVFGTGNKYKNEIEIYYFLAFNEDYTKLKYAWRVPGEMVEGNTLYIGVNTGKGQFNVENMKEYEITDKIKKII